ncbi:hypothetical protein Tco_1470876 [Tanacetum coccineum]
MVKAISTPLDTLKTPGRILLELEDQINFLLKLVPKASSTHVPQACIKAVSSSPHPRNLNEPPRENSFTFCKRIGPYPQPQALESTFEAREEKSTKDEAIFDDISGKPDKSKAVASLKEVDVENEAENATRDKLVKNTKEKLKKIAEEKSGETPNYESVGYYLKHKINKKLVEGLIENQMFNDSLSATRVRKMKRETYNLLPKGLVHDAILNRKITRKEDIGGNFEIPCNIG